MTFRLGVGFLLAAALAGAAPRVVLIAGEQEYRAEESLPQLAKILEQRHGMRCTVLYSTDPATGRPDASVTDNIPGLEALRKADLVILAARMLELPDVQMKLILDYTNSGRPILAMRTSTHPFAYRKHPENPYARYSYNSKDPAGGYGRLVLGETWINHWGRHQKQSTRGVIAPGMENHPILRGVKDIWGPSDVYEIKSLSGDSQPLVLGLTLDGMEPTAPPDTAKRTMPVAWVKSYNGARIFTTTMGHAGDFQNEGFRRMTVNAAYWCLKREKRIRPDLNVALVGEYHPGPIGFAKPKR
jgi:hypothetical protein